MYRGDTWFSARPVT